MIQEQIAKLQQAADLVSEVKADCLIGDEDDADFITNKVISLLQGLIASNAEAVISEKIIKSYEHEECPDCHKPIPEDVVDGQECAGCGHVFVLPRSDDDVSS